VDRLREQFASLVFPLWSKGRVGSRPVWLAGFEGKDIPEFFHLLRQADAALYAAKHAGRTAWSLLRPARRGKHSSRLRRYFLSGHACWPVSRCVDEVRRALSSICLPDVFPSTIIGRDKSDAGADFCVNLLLAGPLWLDRGVHLGVRSDTRPVPVRLVPVGSSGHFCCQCGTLTVGGAHFCSACGRAF